MVILGVGVLLFLASLFVALFRRTQIPDVLLLIGLGLLLGPFTRTVTPDAFGRAGHALSTIALTVILFESGLTLRLDALRQSLGATLLMTVLSFAATTSLVAVIGRLALDLPWTLAVALGAILGGTSSAVVVPMVRELPLGRLPATVLVLESGLTDVLTVVLAGALLAAHASGTTSPAAIGSAVLSSFVFAALIGALSALLLLSAISLVRRMPNAMMAVIACVLVTYGLAEAAGASGAIAALTLGFVLGNRGALGLSRLRAFAGAGEREPRYVSWFLSDIIFLLKAFFFVYLGISVRFADRRLGALAVLSVIGVYLTRAAIVRVSMPDSTSRPDARVMAVLGPKGLAAAVLAGVPLQMGVAQGEAIQQLTYMVVLASIVATSVLVPVLVRSPEGEAGGDGTGDAMGRQAAARAS
jgi:NhaP-type Na+/H+ or K+/H+ antiporter